VHARRPRGSGLAIASGTTHGTRRSGFTRRLRAQNPYSTTVPSTARRPKRLPRRPLEHRVALKTPCRQPSGAPALLEKGAKEPFGAPWALQVSEITYAKGPDIRLRARSRRRVQKRSREYEGYSGSTQGVLKSYSLRASPSPAKSEKCRTFRHGPRPASPPSATFTQEARLSPSPEDTDPEASANELSHQAHPSPPRSPSARATRSRPSSSAERPCWWRAGWPRRSW
jgi:hypothetical protein